MKGGQRNSSGKLGRSVIRVLSVTVFPKRRQLKERKGNEVKKWDMQMYKKKFFVHNYCSRLKQQYHTEPMKSQGNSKWFMIYKCIVLNQSLITIRE